MPEPLNKNIAVFLSYRNHEPSKSEAAKLYTRLTHEGFKVFRDVEGLRGGDAWEAKIYSEIRQSDVLVVLLQTNENEDGEESPSDDEKEDISTAKSEWVQREIDVARGANVEILPLNLYLEDRFDIPEVQRLLAINERQFLKYTSEDRAETLREEQVVSALAKSESKSRSAIQKEHSKTIKEQKEEARKNSEKQFGVLVNTLDALAQKTRRLQREWQRLLAENRRPTRAASELSVYSTLVAPDHNKKCKIHIATGDLTELEGIDVIVNSENNYLQMARIFERQTLSSALRQKGGHIELSRLFDDSIQKELQKQIDRIYKQIGLPLALGEVVPTHAGHEKSQLRSQGFKYILHAITVSFSPIEQKDVLTPIQTDDGVHNTLIEIFKNFTRINETGGNIFEEDDFDSGEFETLKSIIFPIIATGHGGRPIKDVIQPMLRACKHAIKKDIAPDLEHIHIAVYAENDILIVEEAVKTIIEESDD